MQVRVSFWFLPVEGFLGETVLHYSPRGRDILSCIYQHFCLPSALPQVFTCKWSIQWSPCEVFYRIMPGSQFQPFTNHFVGGMPTMKCFHFTSKGQGCYQSHGLQAAWHKGWGAVGALLWFSSTDTQLRTVLELVFQLQGSLQRSISQGTHTVGFRVLSGFGATQFSLKPDAKVEASGRSEKGY